LENKFLEKFSWVVYALILLTLNITKVVVFSDSIKFNMALADILIPIFLFISLFFWKQYGFKQTYKSYSIWIGLAAWLFLVAFLAIKNASIVDGGWSGLFEELIKTGLCVLYFFVGYNTLRVLKLRSFKITWLLSTLIFVLGGFVIYILAIKGLYFWSDDPKYLMMFMGTDTDPNHAATFLTLSFFGMGIFAMLSEHMGARGFFYVMMFISSVGLIFTGSRGGLFGFIVGIAILLIYYIFKNWRMALALTLVLILMTMVFLTIDHFYLENVFTQRLLYKLVEIESGFDIRANLSRSAWMMGVDHPLFGVGRGNYILNSPVYFDKLGVDYIESIPHNTYFGLLAETGIVGLILYCMPVLLLVYTIIRRYKRNPRLLGEEQNVLIWLAAGIFALGVQAFVLNVENRRFLWYLAGVLIFLFENETMLKIKKSEHMTTKRLNLGLTALLIFTVVFSFFTINNVNIPHQPKVVAQNYAYEIPFDGFIMNETYEVGINLIIAVNESLTKRVELRIVEIGNDGKTHVIDSFSYSGAGGTVVCKFTPTLQNSKIVIKAHKLDQSLSTFVIQPIYLRDNDQIYNLTQRYFLQTKELQKNTIKNNSLMYDEWAQKTDLKVGLGETFNKEVRVKSVTIKQDDEISTKVSVELEALNTIQDVVYSFLYGFPNDSNILPENLIATNSESYDMIDPIEDLVWQAGDKRTFTFSIPRQNGVYLLRLGAYRVIDGQAVYLTVDDEVDSKSILLDLGWLNLDMFTGKLVFE
jgi:O-antigen ligase